MLGGIFVVLLLLAVLDWWTMFTLEAARLRLLFGQVRWWGLATIAVGGMLFCPQRWPVEVFGGGLLFLGFAWYWFLRCRFQKGLGFLDKVHVRSRIKILFTASGVVFGWALGMAAVAVALRSLGTFWAEGISEMAEMVLGTALSSMLILLLIARATQLLSTKGFWPSVGFDPQQTDFGRTILGPAFLGLAFALCSSWILVARPEQPETPLSLAVDASPSDAWVLGLLFLALGVAPLVEEIIFRGYFFEVLRRVWGPRWAFYSISLSFGVLHVGQYWGDWPVIVMVAMLGFALSAVRVLSQTTRASTVMHYVYNTATTLIPPIWLLARP